MAGEDLIQFPQCAVIQFHLQGGQGVVELAHDPRTNDRGADCGLVQQPGQGEDPGLNLQLSREVLIRLDLFPVLCQQLLDPPLRTAAETRG